MRLLIIITVFLSALLIGIQPMKAADIAPQPCDTQFWQQMSARAWLEAEREIMQNQNLIFKPDSVMDYVCFDQFVNIAARQGGDIFVHTNYFGNIIIPRSQKNNPAGNNPAAMEIALTEVVGKAMIGYKTNNFGHAFLGGRAENLSIEPKQHTISPPTSSIDDPGYTCKNMSEVWKTAKCMNFIDNSEFEKTDGFYPFKSLKAHNGGEDVAGYEDFIEVRNFPAACAAQNSGVTNWSTAISDATNDNDTMYQFQTPLGKIFKEVNDRILPVGGENGTSSCGTAIKTGVKIYKDGKEDGDDGVCTNPGCTYKGGSCS